MILSKKEQIRKIENHLRQYKTYKVGIKNLHKQLDYILPTMTANYEIREGSAGSFVISSSTENCAIDRIESKRALDLHEQIQMYSLIVESIDNALLELPEQEREFITLRYFNSLSINRTAETMGYTADNIFRIRKQAFDKLTISLSSLIGLAPTF